MNLVMAIKQKVTLFTGGFDRKNLGLSAILSAGLWALMASSFSLAEAETITAGDIAAGKAKSAVCAACHGADGNSGVASFPKLAGQSERYIAKQLKDMKTSARNVPEMTAFVVNLNEQDMRDLGAFYASQTGTVEGANAETFELGEKLYRAGNMDTGVPSCAACHGANGNGIASAGFPKLSGQHAAYTEAQLKAFRAAGRDDSTGKRRDNDAAKMMRSIAAKMSDKEITALADYISGLH